MPGSKSAHERPLATVRFASVFLTVVMLVALLAGIVVGIMMVVSECRKPSAINRTSRMPNESHFKIRTRHSLMLAASALRLSHFS